MRHIRLAAVALCAVSALPGTPLTFTSGHLFWANQVNFKLYDVTAGGNLSAPPVVANGVAYQGGQIAFTADLTAAYLTGGKAVYKITPGNQAMQQVATATFNTLGMLVTPEGRLFVSGNGRVYEVVAGALVEYATGLSGVRNLLWTPTGILAVRQYAGEVVNIGFTGGSKTNAPRAAQGIVQAKDIQMFNGRIYVSGQDGVYDITGGGTVTSANLWASGQNIMGLAATKDKLYAVNADANPRIFDITAGGAFLNSSAWGYSLPSLGDSMFDVVPYLPEEPPVTTTPEGGTLSLVTGGVLVLLGRRARALRTKAV